MAARAIAGDDAMAELVAAIGAGAARQLARTFGGTAVYVPRSIGDHHPLCAAIGRPAADALAAWTGGSSIAVPKRPERRARVQELHRAGALTIAEIARETDYSERHVYRLLSDADDDRQLGLFDDAGRP